MARVHGAGLSCVGLVPGPMASLCLFFETVSVASVVYVHGC